MLQQPLVQGIALMVVLGFVVFVLYLRRAMVYLDPSHVVPDRVRSALDTLTEGVLVLDAQQHVLMANQAFRDWLPAGVDPVGRTVASITWLADAATGGANGAPWARALKTNVPQIGMRLELQVSGTVRHVILNCSPINEGGGDARGCLLTLTDVTDLHERTERLRVAMAELEDSKEEIRKKNDELELLATRDPLTGCLNRRAFAAESAPRLDAAARERTPVSVIMCDIDHFKRVNDTYGHAGGDVVLQAAAKLLGRGLRPGDLLARFGGEEFCILLPDAPAAQAREIAERLRADVEAHLGGALREHPGVRVTMSFGVEQFGARRDQIDGVIDLADQALYHSKKNGRNRVTAYADVAEAGTAETAVA